MQRYGALAPLVAKLWSKSRKVLQGRLVVVREKEVGTLKTETQSLCGDKNTALHLSMLNTSTKPYKMSRKNGWAIVPLLVLFHP